MRSKLQAHIVFLSLTLLIFTLLRLPSLFEPHWYGDEGIYQVIGLGLREGRTMYLGVWDNKPPLLFILYALFGQHQLHMRLLSLTFGLAATVVFFFITRLLFKKTTASCWATTIFSLFLALPFIEGNIANAENFMILPTLVGMYLFLKSKVTNTRLLFVSGVMLSIAFLFKIVAIFDIFAVCLMLLFFGRLRGLLSFIAGGSAPMLITFVYVASGGLLTPFISALFLDNAGYTTWKNHFLVTNGLLYVKTLILFVTLCLLFIKRTSLPKNLLFIFLWVSFALYNAYFSGRGYGHYLLLLLPSFSLLVGMIIEQEFKERRLVYVTITVVVLISMHFNLYKNIWGYYLNALSWKTGIISEAKYQMFFDPMVIRDYAIVDYIQKHVRATDDVFIWGNNAQIYFLTGKLPPGRLSVAYHIRLNQATIDETQRAIENTRPKYIIILPMPEPYPYSLAGYKKQTSVAGAPVYELEP